MSSCREIMELCVQNCRYGYQLIPSSKVGECTSCLCQPGIDHIHDLIRTMTDNKNMIVILNWPEFFLVLSYSKHYHAQNRINKTRTDIVFMSGSSAHSRIFQLPQCQCQQHRKWLPTIHLVRMASSVVWQVVAMVTSWRLQKMAAVPAAIVSHVRSQSLIDTQ